MKHERKYQRQSEPVLQSDVPIKSLTADDRNVNRHTDRGAKLIESSIKRLGAGRSILLDKNGKIIAGNATHKAAGVAGMQDVIIVKTDGKKLVAVQREDLDLDKDPAARELAIVDNRAGELNLDYDPSVLQELSDDGVDLAAVGITPDELKAILKDAADPGEVELRQHSTKPPPRMTWILIGVPTVHFGKIAADVDRIAAVSGVISEITSNDAEVADEPDSKI